MEITTFNPMILSPKADEVIKLFEELGFERRHHKTDIEDGANDAVAMKDADGNRISIASSETIPQDITGIVINVDNFQEAYDFFMARGFINPRGDKVTDTSSSRATMLFAPSGFAVTIAEHIKK